MVAVSFRIEPGHLEYLRDRANQDNVTVSDMLREILDIDREMWLNATEQYSSFQRMLDTAPKFSAPNGPINNAATKELLQQASGRNSNSRPRAEKTG